MFKKNIIKKSIIWILFCLINTNLIAANNDSRIKDELNSPQTETPLKQALGEKKYKQEINSGKYYFVGNTKCRLCHREFFIGRKKDKHDFAFKRLVETGHETNPKCLVCHTTGFGVPTGFKSIEETPRLANVQCEGCHGPGSLHIKIARKTKKGGGFLASPDDPKVLKKMCNACHNSRWNRSYHEKDLDKVYKLYKSPDPRKRKNRVTNENEKK
ncbi:cytochrome c family protein [Nitrosophilus labii]|uniref:cytochrome c family protein n=1 Tax=Nitrosophilus labii TaxID=2706014 RepID=UPI001656F93C|nr:cytochrome c family protein [Nitrosophilus labii]